MVGGKKLLDDNDVVDISEGEENDDDDCDDQHDSVNDEEGIWDG